MITLRFVAMDPTLERNLYLDCYADAWRVSNGSLEDFLPEHYFDRALYHSRLDPDALVKALIGEDTVGVIELDPERGASAGYGWITLCYMLPDYRGLGLAVQLLGHAASFFRERDRAAIRLHVSELNTRAISFYRRCGFVEIGSEMGIMSRRLLMEMAI